MYKIDRKGGGSKFVYKEITKHHINRIRTNHDIIPISNPKKSNNLTFSPLDLGSADAIAALSQNINKVYTNDIFIWNKG